MEILKFNYETPKVSILEVEVSDVLCLSGVGNESFTDGGWNWDDEE